MRAIRFPKSDGTNFDEGASIPSAKPTSFLLLLLLFPWSVSFATPESLFDRHWEWRERYADGIDVSEEVRRHLAATGDYSFEALLFHCEEVAEALRLQRRGLKRWDAGDRAAAVDLFLHAARRLTTLGARSEAIFCLYYVAEILAEREEFAASLQWIELAMGLDDGLPRPFLHGILLENSAYSLWYLDGLPEAILRFTRALRLWTRIDFRWGMVTSWNNLAVLYQETHLPRRARDGFRKSLAAVDDSLPEIVRFRLHANYAELLHEMDEEEEALRQLESAAPFQESFPEEFLLLQAKILGVTPFAESLLDLQTPVPSLQVERALLLARHFEQERDEETASHWLGRALEIGKQNELPFLSRRTLLRMGEWMEKTGRLEEAAALYFEVVSREERLSAPDTKFPFSRLISPFFSGWIRTLTATGRQEEARRGLRTLGRLRMERARRFSEWVEVPPPVESDSDLVAVGARLDFAMPSVELDWKSAAQQVGREEVVDGYNLVELWPEAGVLLAWVTHQGGTEFLRIPLPDEWHQRLDAVLAPLFDGRDLLPNPPDRETLLWLYRHLFAPFEPQLDSDRVLLVPYGKLQHLPFEMLVDESGSYLLERLVFSYLPQPDVPAEKLLGPGRAEVILPRRAPGPTEFQKEELFFRLHFPEVTVRHDLKPSQDRALVWLHISTHFRLDERFWLVSHFEDGVRELHVLSFLQAPSLPLLLSLGVCDAGNSYASDSLHWLGFAELIVARGVRALVLSRWRMDEFSSRIYRDFYTRAVRGEALDTALTKARRSFLSQFLRRGTRRASGEHPFFWAGITYVGAPGLTLGPAVEKTPTPPEALLLLLLGLTLLLTRDRGARFRSPGSTSRSAGNEGDCPLREESARFPRGEGGSRPASCEKAR